MRLRADIVEWEFLRPFRTSHRQRTHARTVVVHLSDGSHAGRGECLGVAYRGETAESIVAQLQACAAQLEAGATVTDLLAQMPPGGARNGLDCASWDIEAKRQGKRAWQLAGMSTAKPVHTCLTLGLEELSVTTRAAEEAEGLQLLKIKLNGADDIERVRAVRAVRPDATLVVDANEAWTPDHLSEVTPQLARLGVTLIEQPLRAGHDEALLRRDRSIPFCADESCQTSASLPALLGKYDWINVKLDKTGGLTEGLCLTRRARELGFQILVGCMGGSSLSMAPGFVAAQLADLADLDGPLLTRTDVPHAIRYEGSLMHQPDAELWG